MTSEAVVASVWFQLGWAPVRTVTQPSALWVLFFWVPVDLPGTPLQGPLGQTSSLAEAQLYRMVPTAFSSVCRTIRSFIHTNIHREPTRNRFCGQAGIQMRPLHPPPQVSCGLCVSYRSNQFLLHQAGGSGEVCLRRARSRGRV